MDRPVRVSVWSDFVCPFCYIGKRRLERAAEATGIPIRVTWRSFELDPNSPQTQSESLVDSIATKYGVSRSDSESMQRRVASLAAAEGLDFQWQIAKTGNTFNAHRILHLAASVGQGSAAEQAFMDAHFSRGQAIGEPDVVRDIALELGLDAAEVDRVLTTDAYADAVREDERFATQEIGVHGVPFFVFEDAEAIEGAQPIELFEQALRSARERVDADA